MNALKRTFGFIYQHPLAGQHLFKAFYRFLKWQIRSRWSDKFVPVAFISGTKLLARRRLVGMTANIYTGLSDFEEMGFLLHFLTVEDTFFDVGANVGTYTILASGVCGAQTVCFEPAPSTFEILIENIRLNKLENLVKPVNAAVSSKHEQLNFTIHEDATNHVSAYNTTETASIVNGVCLDDYANHAPALLKIDVEGYETEVLKGAISLLKNDRLKAIIIELNGSGNRYGFDEQAIHRQLLVLGFAPYRYEPFKRLLTRLDSPQPFNTTYIRDVDFVSQKLKRGRAFSVFNQTI